MVEGQSSARINKLDSFFLWVASLSGIGFSVFISYLHFPVLPYVAIFVLIGFSVYIGYLKGAVFGDSLTDRLRGWYFLLVSLAVYLPLVSINLTEGYIKQQFSNYSTFEPILSFAGVPLVISFLIISQKITTPAIYKNFGKPFGDITKKIFFRTVMQSLILGISLYILVLALGQANLESSYLLSSVIYVGIIIILFFQMVTQERRIEKLKPFERLQNHVKVEPVEKNLINNLMIFFLILVAVILQIIQTLPSSDFKANLNLAFSFFLVLFAFGFVLSLFHSDRGDMVSLKDDTKDKLENDDLNYLINNIKKVNS